MYVTPANNLVFLVQLCGQTLGAQRQFNEKVARGDNDENGRPRARFNEEQAAGKFAQNIFAKKSC